MGSPVCLLSNSRISSTEWKSSSAWRGVILTSASPVLLSAEKASARVWADLVWGGHSCPPGFDLAELESGRVDPASAPTARRSTRTAQPTAKSSRRIPEERLLALFIEIEFIRFRILFPHDRTKPVNLWTSNEHARDYLERADSISHRSEGEAALLEFIPPTRGEFSTSGTGDGRLLSLVG